MIIKLKSLRSHEGFMKYFKNTSWLFLEKIFRIFIGLFVGIWVARYLGPEQFGLFSYALSFSGLFTVIATLGLDEIIIRELVKNENQRDALLGTGFILKFFGGIVALLFLLIAVQFTTSDFDTKVYIFIIASATIFQCFNVIDFYFQSKVLSKYIVFVNIISLFLSSAIKVICILSNAPLIAFVYIVLFDNFVLAIGFIYFYLKESANNKLGLLKWKFDRVVAKYLLKNSWPLILGSAMLMVQARIDQVMIKEMIDDATVGYYSVALRLIEAFAFVPGILKNSLWPSIIQSRNNSNELYQDRLLNFYRLNFLIFLIIAIPIFIFAEEIVILLFGIAYQNAGSLFALMSTRLFFTNMGIARSAFLVTENLLKFSLITMILGTITNVVLNYLFIEEYGAHGAIVATIVSFFVTVFLIDAFYSKTRNNFFLMMKGIFTFFKIGVYNK